jgi:autoinducer 2-degrading protein
MLHTHVMIHVKEASLEAFRQASLENAAHSRQEPGIVSFDLMEQEDDPTRFVLIEVYRDADAPRSHKQTAHYLAWREKVEPMMASPRHSIHYRPC